MLSVKHLALGCLVAAAVVFPAAAVEGTQDRDARSTARTGALVYVPLGTANAILVVDPGKDAVKVRVDGVHNVHGLAGTPDGRFLVAGSESERPAGGPAPAASGEASDAQHSHAPAAAKSQASRRMLSTVSVVRTSDYKVVHRIDVPGGVHHVAVSPNGRFAVVTHPARGGITAIDLASHRVIGHLATGPGSNYAAFSRDGARVFVSNADNGTVSDVAVGRWKVQRNFAVGQTPEHVVLSRDGRTLFVNNVGDGTVSVLDVAAGTTAQTLAVGGGLHGIDVSDDGGTLFVAAMREHKLVAVDLRTGAQRSLPLKPAPYHVAAVRKLGKIYVSSAQEPLVWVVDSETLTVLSELPIGGKGHQMFQAESR